MRVLIACEYSGRVRDAFNEKGHDVISCDILPTAKHSSQTCETVGSISMSCNF